ncbi:MAG: hypothetical protein J7K40_14335 [candidate division Zixibacteria bacterium]|nr:hypothetical protein [candidate division Zixibacteria bacterium]
MAVDFPSLADYNALREFVIGVEWNQNTDTWRRIDEYGNTVDFFDYVNNKWFFDNHPIWGNIRRCTLADDGTVNNYGSTPRGDGLTLDGTDGQVMVEIPKFYIKASNPATNVYQRWISPVAKTGFEVHPFFLQRGGTERDRAYFGAYEAYYDSGSGKLESKTGVAPTVSTTIGNFRMYAENRGSVRWGITSIWALSAIQSLFYIESGGIDSQSFVGMGNVDTSSAQNTGANSIDTYINENGTGKAKGINGLVGIAYRGIENLWGNIWTFVDGYNALADNSAYRLINRDGSGTFQNTLAATCEDSVAAPITTDGYVSNIEYEDLLKYLMIPSAVTGSSISDYFYAHDAGELNILLSGDTWAGGGKAGVAGLHSLDVAAFVSAYVGARLEFV